MKKEDRKNRISGDSKTDFNDLGLEPPKIYRDTKAYKDRQERIEREKNTKKKSNSKKSQKTGKSGRSETSNLTRAEKRELESKKRKKKNAIRKVMTWFIICITILGVGLVLSLTVFFKIGSIEVVGNERYATEEILAQCTIDVGENMFISDTKGASEMIERNLPYIYDAEIKRKLPDKIVINITETQPEYCIKNEDETYILLDDRFKVMELNSENASGMEILNAQIISANNGQLVEFEDENVSTCLNTIAYVLKENGFEGFTAISSEGLNNNYIIYDNRITFKLGTTQELEKKIYQGLATCEKLDDSSPNVEGELTLTGDKQIYFTEK